MAPPTRTRSSALYTVLFVLIECILCRGKTFDEIREENRRRQLQQYHPQSSPGVRREGKVRGVCVGTGYSYTHMLGFPCRYREDCPCP